MKSWKDRIWLLVLVIVGSSIMTFCKSGGSGGGNSTTNLAFANGFKPSDISGVMICSNDPGQYQFSGSLTYCYSDNGSGSSNFTLSELFSQGWRPVGPLYSMGASGRSPTLFYK